jgi:hypothetical protein
MIASTWKDLRVIRKKSGSGGVDFVLFSALCASSHRKIFLPRRSALPEASRGSMTVGETQLASYG